MELRFFDFEVYPHWWCVTFGKFPEGELNQDNRWDFVKEDIKKDFVTIDSDDPKARDKVMDIIQGVCIPGYNIKKYDLTILNAVYQGFSPEQIKIISDITINKSLAYASKEHLRLSSFANKRMRGVTYLDLFDSSTGSLKDKEAILGLSVMETNVPFDKEDLTDEDKVDIKKYNVHDVWSSMVWYAQIVEPFIHAKLMLCKKFGLEERWGYNDTNAGLVARALGVKKRDYPDAEETTIQLHPKIKSYCEENLPPEVLAHVLNNTSTFKINMFENEVVFADGGIHSVYNIKKYKKHRDDTPVLYVMSDDEYVLINVDAESYYPSMMIQFQTLSRSIPDPQMFDDILQERFAIKHKPNKTKDDDDTQLADKLVLNTTYGASGSEWLPFFDPYQRTRTCGYGQLFLIALANKLYTSIDSLKVIQTNTDGILCYVKHSDLDKVKELMAEWTRVSGIGMEEDYVDAIWQRDVNNYCMVKKGGKLKIKGGWLNQTIIRPGYIMISPRTAFVCAKAVTQWLLNGKDIVQSIVANTDLMDFVITTTKGPTYSGVVQRMANGWEVPMYKCNRLIATKDENYGKLYKTKRVKDSEGGYRISYSQMPNTPDHCLCLNDDMSHYSFKELKPQIDYMYYIQRCAELLDMTFVELSHENDFETNQFNYFD